MSAPIVSYGLLDGEPGDFSTVVLPDESIETCFFPDDPNLQSHVVGRHYPWSPQRVHSANLHGASTMAGIYT